MIALFDKNYFESAYRSYERQNPAKKMGYYHRLVSAATTSIVKPRILDIGCAFGGFLSSLDADWELYGIDVSDYAVSQARERLPHAHIVTAHAMEIPFDDTFDVITAFDVIEHIPDLARVGASISSRLAPHGRFIFTVPVYDGPAGPIIHRLDKDTTHIHKESRYDWLTWANRYFHDEQRDGIFRYLLPGGLYVHWPTRWARRWAPAITVIARGKS